LLKEFFGTDVLLWCGWGPCENQAMNNGATEQTEQAAYQTLFDKFEEDTGDEPA